MEGNADENLTSAADRSQQRRHFMMRIIKMVKSGIRYGQSRDSQASDISSLYPRIWKVLIVLAVPFVIITSHYFEALERTGVLGAYIADLLLPVSIIGYSILVFMLRKREV